MASRLKLITRHLKRLARENDECIMERLVREGVRGAELVSINRARKQQEALFLSDIVTANGKKIDPIYLTDRCPLKDSSGGTARFLNMAENAQQIKTGRSGQKL